MYEQLLAAIKEIPGWMGDQELDHLYNMVKDAPRDVMIVEIGAWKGRSTAALYKGMTGCQRVVTIDSWLGQEDRRFSSQQEVTKSDIFLQFISYMKELEIEPRWYTPQLYGAMYLRMLADDAVVLFDDNSIFRLMLDGDHNKVGADVDRWLPKMKIDGEICGHDFNWPGLKEQVEERLIIREVIGTLWTGVPK